MSEERDAVRAAKLRLKAARLRKKAARVAAKLAKVERRGQRHADK